MIKERVCPFCGENLPDGTAFCPVCFHSLEEAETVLKPADKHTGRRIALAAGSAGLAAAVLVLALHPWSQPLPAGGGIPPRLYAVDLPDPDAFYDILAGQGIQPSEDGGYITKDKEILDKDDIYITPDGHVVIKDTPIPGATLALPPQIASGTSLSQTSARTSADASSSFPVKGGSSPPSNASGPAPESTGSSRFVEPTASSSAISSHPASTASAGAAATTAATGQPAASDWSNAVVAAEEDCRYTVTNGEATLEKYNGSAKELILPKTLGGYPLTTVGGFKYNCIVRRVKIPEGVTAIQKSAFYEAAELREIYMPDSIIQIGTSAFQSCKKLSTVRLSPRLTALPDSCFWACASLKSISLPQGLTNLGGGTFIGTGLTQIFLPASVQQMGSPFSYCSQLQAVNVDGQNAVYFSKDGVLFKRDAVFSQYISLEYYPPARPARSYTVPSWVTHINGQSFTNCTLLEEVTLPPPLQTIYGGAFKGCTSLKTVTAFPHLYDIGYGAFQNCAAL